MDEAKERIGSETNEEASDGTMDIASKTEKRKRGRPMKEERKKGKEQEKNNSKITDWWRTDTEEEREDEAEEEGEKSTKKPNRKKTPQKEEVREKRDEQETINIINIITSKMEDIKKEITKGKIELKEEVKGLTKRIKNIEESWQRKEEELWGKVAEMMNQMEKNIQEERAQREEKEEKLIQEVLQKTEEKIEQKLKAEGRGKEDIDKKVRELSTEMRKVRRELEEREKRERRNNIIIKGLKLKKKEAKETIEQFFRNELGSKANIMAVKTKGMGEEVSTAIVEMKDWEAKQEVMKKKWRLGKQKIYIDHDLTEEERYVQRKLRERAREERNENKEAKVGYRKIRIQGKWYGWDENKGEIQERKGF